MDRSISFEEITQNINITINKITELLTIEYKNEKNLSNYDKIKKEIKQLVRDNPDLKHLSFEIDGVSRPLSFYIDINEEQ